MAAPKSDIESAMFALQSGGADEARRIYFDLLNDPSHKQNAEDAYRYILKKLDETEDLDCDLPDDPAHVLEWIHDSVSRIGIEYRAYLRERAAGGGRRYFSNKSHALYFLRCVAPTKLVDGSWLYGLIRHWEDVRFLPLIQIYLEELGEGVPNKNHVFLYKKLLAANDCDTWDDLTDEHFVQGAIQLSLAYHADQLLPEVIGFNLGYEQLPLHLLITSHELAELGINPYYFKLHVTVDNAATGHAKKALSGLLNAVPFGTEASHFYQRVARGYKLNMLGACTTSVISSFDINSEIVAILSRKGKLGSLVHSDYCRISGRTVSDWLSNPHDMPRFLDALQETGWIKRHAPPKESRFWSLIQGDSAKMFGVFSRYEQQVLYDWIAGDEGQAETGLRVNSDEHGCLRLPVLAPRSKKRSLDRAIDGLDSGWSGTERRNSRAGMVPHVDHEKDDNYESDLRLLERKLRQSRHKEYAMALITSLMSPSYHYTPTGLMATRIFSEALRERY